MLTSSGTYMLMYALTRRTLNVPVLLFIHSRIPRSKDKGFQIAEGGHRSVQPGWFHRVVGR